MRTLFLRLLPLLSAALLLAAPAGALTVEVELVGGGTQSWSDATPGNPLGCSTSGGITSCAGSGLVGGPNWTLDSWNVEADADPFVDANLSLTNNSGSTQTFVMTVTTPASIAAPASSGASVAGTLTVDGDGGTLGHNGTTALFTALVDGSPYDTLLPDDSSVTLVFGSGSTGGDSFGLPGLTQAVPGGVTSSIGIRLEFTLTPGDQASFTSRFEVVPEPTTALLALTGLSGLALFGRRRL